MIKKSDIRAGKLIDTFRKKIGIFKITQQRNIENNTNGKINSFMKI